MKRLTEKSGQTNRWLTLMNAQKRTDGQERNFEKEEWVDRLTNTLLMHEREIAQMSIEKIKMNTCDLNISKLSNEQKMR